MPVNRGHVGDGDGVSTYQLLLKEYNGEAIFWTGPHNRFQCEVRCKFKESDLHFPISKVLSSYLIPQQFLNTPIGRNHLVTPNTQKQVRHDDPLQVLFSKGLKEVTLFLDFGPDRYHAAEQLEKDKEEFRRSEKSLDEASKIPGFMKTKYGIKMSRLLDKMEKDKKEGNLPEMQRNLYALNPLIRKGIMEHRQNPKKTTNFYAIVVNGLLVILAVLCFFYLSSDFLY